MAEKRVRQADLKLKDLGLDNVYLLYELDELADSSCLTSDNEDDKIKAPKLRAYQESVVHNFSKVQLCTFCTRFI